MKWYRRYHRELVECSFFDDVLIQIVICIFYCKYHKNKGSRSGLLICSLFMKVVGLLRFVVFLRVIVFAQTEEGCLTKFTLPSVFSCVICERIISKVDILFFHEFELLQDEFIYLLIESPLKCLVTKIATKIFIIIGASKFAFVTETITEQKQNRNRYKNHYRKFCKILPQQVFTCSKLTIETIEQGGKYVWVR